MINRAVLQGRLTRDPELRTTHSGVSVCSFRIVWSEKFKENETKLFLPCTAWRGTGEFVAKYFTKGQEIVIEGKLQTREWQDRNGNDRSTIEMTVDNVSFCGPKRDNAGGQSSYGSGRDVPPPNDGYSIPDEPAGLFGDGDFEPLDEEQMPF